jgi:hypothetical protein
MRLSFSLACAIDFPDNQKKKNKAKKEKRKKRQENEIELLFGLRNRFPRQKKKTSHKSALVNVLVQNRKIQCTSIFTLERHYLEDFWEIFANGRHFTARYPPPENQARAPFRV